MRSRSTLSLAIAATALALSLTACGGTSETASSSGAGATTSASTEAATSSAGSSPVTSSGETAGTSGSTASQWAPPPAFADIADQFSDFTAPEPGSGAGLKIGFINLDDSVPYHHAVGEGMKKAAEAAGAELVSCDAEGKAQQALQCAQSFTAQGVQGYINAQLESGAAAGICAAGPQVPVLSQDVTQAPCSTALYGVNNRFAGYLGGVALGELLKAKTDCEYDAYVSEEAAAAGQLNTDRMGGYREGFASVCGEIHDERTVDAFRIDNAQTAFRDVLTALPAAQTIVVQSWFRAMQRERHSRPCNVPRASRRKGCRVTSTRSSSRERPPASVPPGRRSRS